MAVNSLVKAIIDSGADRFYFKIRLHEVRVTRIVHGYLIFVAFVKAFKIIS